MELALTVFVATLIIYVIVDLIDTKNRVVAANKTASKVDENLKEISEVIDKIEGKIPGTTYAVTMHKINEEMTELEHSDKVQRRQALLKVIAIVFLSFVILSQL